MNAAIGGLGIGIGLTLPPLDDVKPKSATLSTLGLGQPQLRWPYSTRSHSSTHTFGGYDSSPTPSSSSSSESEPSVKQRSASGSATHDVLLSYFSPDLSDAGVGEEETSAKKVYLLSSGLKNPKRKVRSKSETFKFPLPPGKTMPLKSALRSTSAKFHYTSPPLRSSSGPGWRHRSWMPLSPALEEPRSGWSPYSSVAPTPRQASHSHRFSLDSSSSVESQPPTYESAANLPRYSFARNAGGSSSSCSSQTLVSEESETDSGVETDEGLGSEDAAKLARLHASLMLLNGGVSELPLSAGSIEKDKVVVGGSVEEKMAYLCGLGYRYRRGKGSHGRKRSSDSVEHRENEHGEGELRQGTVESFAPKVVGADKMVRVVSNVASAVTSGQSSPILGSMLSSSFDQDDAKGEADHYFDHDQDVTIRPHFQPESSASEDFLGEDFSYLVDDDLINSQEWQSDAVETCASVESGLMTPPLTTPELGLDGASPMFLDKWPSPFPAQSSSATTRSFSPKQVDLAVIDGCRPYSTSSSIYPFRFNSSLQPSFSQPASSLTSSASCPVSISNLASEKQTGLDEEGNGTDLEEEAQISQARRTTISACSVLNRPRPVPSRSGDGHGHFSFANKDLSLPRSKSSQPRLGARPKLAFSQSEQTMPKSASTTAIPRQIKVPQRKSSLDIRAEAHLHQIAEQRSAVVPTDAVPRMNIRQELPRDQYHSSAEAYLQPVTHRDLPSTTQVQRHDEREVCASAGITAKTRRRGSAGGSEMGGLMTKSFSLPVLFTARTPSQRARGETGLARDRARRKSVVFAGPLIDEEDDDGVLRVAPPREGVLVVEEQVTTVGVAF
ncbi:RNA-directed RNA polymerase [Pseudozyma hubeiensis SY62]|uniref:RNA-directed RNA polymerase n=1 Tax=Pseudozyma hubeiensis (strain SY62) TaxID=1305764 RepID=R9P7X9_PSEHS|nr:RNA-directed RNA polymerase [Pseudozyma hubeiensis SY62]GAC97508.1 RNA-directed RNA polymerase [Pseudozyma hubeiensis SY62]